MKTPNAAAYATYPSLADRTVFVTGGADGIGAAIVEEFVRQGSKVGFADINVAKAAETVARCAMSKPRHTPRFYEVDLVDIDATQAAVRQAQTDLGGLTVLVNNAASDERHSWDELSATEKQARFYDFSTPKQEREITQEMPGDRGRHNR